MSLLSSVLGAALGGGQQQGSVNPMLQAVLGMLADSGQGAQGGGLGGALGGALGGMLGGASAQGGQGGGLGALIEAFGNAGLGNLMQSWIGTGQNLPVSADQLQQALGSERIGGLAQQLGMSHGDAAGQLAELLPQIIDKLTPHGQVPQGGLGDIGSMLSALANAHRG
jgi:uncharacterized protein YidB (DUF937 family)